MASQCYKNIFEIALIFQGNRIGRAATVAPRNENSEVGEGEAEGRQEGGAQEPAEEGQGQEEVEDGPPHVAGRR